MKNKFQPLIILFTLFIYQNGIAQFEIPDSLKHKNYKEVILMPKVEKYGSTVVQRQLMYPNGQKGILKHIEKNLKYPEDAFKNGIEGTVTIKFVVDTSGNVTNVSVIKSVYPSLDSEAIRVISSLDKFLPLIQRNKPNKVALSQDIVFQLKKKKRKK